MAEIVVVTWDGGGNVPPAFAIATELMARGHRVRVLGHPAQREAIEGAGFTAVRTSETRDFRVGGGPGLAELLATFGDKGMGRDLRAELARRPADLVLVDALMLGALDAARESGVRYAVLEHFFDEYYQSALGGPLGFIVRARGLRPRRSLRDAALRVVTSLPELDRVRPGAPVTQVGPIVTWRPRAAAEPTVLVSLSTFGYAGMEKRLQAAIDGMAGLPARIIVTTGPHVDPASLRAPAGVEVHRYVPHDELMPHADVVLGHGGHGTAMRALAHDATVVVTPLDAKADHRLVGRSIERAGAGRLLASSAPPHAIGEAVGTLLADGPHRAAAARLGAAIRSTPGVPAAAAALEAVLPAGPVAAPETGVLATA
jgi:UDP:flavonoid glycosyltransferase YjiC (YdhE family)